MSRVLLAAAIALAGCSSTVPADRACADAADARCSRTDACGTDAIAARYGDLATCLARETAACLDRLVAPSTSDTGPFEAGCAQAIAAESCVDLAANRLFLACIAPPGGLDDGAPCVDHAQCGRGHCNVGRARTCGVCGPAARAGGSCETASCGRGLLCVGAPGVCVAPGAMSDPCDGGHPCGLGLVCVGASAGMSGSCQPAIAMPDAACDPTATIGAGCDPALGLACDPASSTCVSAAPPPPPLPDGADCDTLSGPPCTAPAVCVSTGDGTGGVCGRADSVTCR
jgi:hypothetical protein